MTFHEGAVLALFILLVLLWFLRLVEEGRVRVVRKPGFLGGWAGLLQWEGRAGETVTIGAASPTLAVVLLLFVVPADPRGHPGGPTLLQWGVVQTRLPSSSSSSFSSHSYSCHQVGTTGSEFPRAVFGFLFISLGSFRLLWLGSIRCRRYDGSKLAAPVSCVLGHRKEHRWRWVEERPG